MNGPEVYRRNLQACRKAAGLSQERLSALAGYERNTIMNIENGKHSNSRIQTICDLAQVLGIHPTDLMKEPDENGT